MLNEDEKWGHWLKSGKSFFSLRAATQRESIRILSSNPDNPFAWANSRINSKAGHHKPDDFDDRMAKYQKQAEKGEPLG